MDSYNERRKIIIKHYLTPTNKVDNLENFQIKNYKHSNQCADELEIGIKFENDIIIDCKFIATGCSIFIASTDIMISEIINKKTSEAIKIIDNYLKMINNKQDYDLALVNKLIVFKNVAKHYNRLICASIVSDCLMPILKQRIN